jgi:hypothetical protein
MKRFALALVALFVSVLAQAQTVVAPVSIASPKPAGYVLFSIQTNFNGRVYATNVGAPAGTVVLVPSQVYAGSTATLGLSWKAPGAWTIEYRAAVSGPVLAATSVVVGQ